MFKKVLKVVSGFIIIASLAFGLSMSNSSATQPFVAKASAAITGTCNTTQSALPPSAVGTYNDFGDIIRLDIYVKGTNASQFKIYWAPGYNATSGFQSKYVDATPNYTDPSNQKAVRTGITVPYQGMWTIMVVSVRCDGVTSKPFTTSVDVIR